jgi:hypothetical protein
MHPPIAVGLFICQQLIVEERTRNITLVNCFMTLNCEGFPSRPRSLTLYVVLTDGLGDIPVELVVSRLDTFIEVYRQAQSITLTDRLEERGVLFRLIDCTFPRAGRYHFSILAAGEPVAQRVLTVAQFRGGP